MIRFRNRTLEEFSIDPVTAIITNSKGEVQSTYVIKGRPYFKHMPIHQIQVYTHVGWKKCLVVHHLDENKMNNSLSNLVYLTKSEHAKLHNKTREFSKETKRKISESHKGKQLSYEMKKKLSIACKGKNAGEKNGMYGKRYKWINNGFENRYIPLAEDIPEGFVKGRLKK